MRNVGYVLPPMTVAAVTSKTRAQDVLASTRSWKMVLSSQSTVTEPVIFVGPLSTGSALRPDALNT